MAKMSFELIDMVYGVLLNDLLGSVALLIFAIVVVVLLLVLRTGMPAYFAFLLPAPLIVGLAKAGMIPAYFEGVVLIILGAILGFIMVSLFTK